MELKIVSIKSDTEKVYACDSVSIYKLVWIPIVDLKGGSSYNAINKCE